MTHELTDGLPELPPQVSVYENLRGYNVYAYTGAQMRAYARAAVLAHLAQRGTSVQPPEFQEVSWGVDSTMRPVNGMAVSEYAFRQWAKDVGIVLAASPQAVQPMPDGGEAVRGGER
jgi:hypothetical protein